MWSAKQIGGVGKCVWCGVRSCGCGEVRVGVGRWVWVWGGRCGEVGVGVGVGMWCGCDVGGCGRWVQVMEHVRIEVWK